MKRLTFATVVFTTLAFFITPVFSGVEPSPFKSTKIKNRGDLKLTANLLLPAIKDFKKEIAKAKSRVKKFDPAKGKNLKGLNYTNKSIPQMKACQSTMQGIIDDGKNKMGVVMEDLVPRNQKLLKILKNQQGNLNNPKSAMKALNQMEKILGEMEAVLK